MDWRKMDDALKTWGVSLEYPEDKFNLFGDMVRSANETMNLTRITDEEEMVEKHFLDSLSLYRVPQMKQADKILDLGTGAGFPGMVLGITSEEDTEIVLLDSLQKRITFLQKVAETLALPHVHPIHGRAEELGRSLEHREQYPVVVARAVARLDTLLEYAMGFVSVGGIFIAMKGQDGMKELKEAKQALNILHGTCIDTQEFKLPSGDQRTLIVVKKTKTLEDKYPRGGGKPRKSPL